MPYNTWSAVSAASSVTEGRTTSSWQPRRAKQAQSAARADRRSAFPLPCSFRFQRVPVTASISSQPTRLSLSPIAEIGAHRLFPAPLRPKQRLDGLSYRPAAAASRRGVAGEFLYFSHRVGDGDRQPDWA